jgi:rhamnosyltransferase
MTENSVCAVIVTYHPNSRMLENIPKAMAQTQGLIVVDNGSDACELEPLRATSQRLGFQLIEKGENLGLAEALNEGVRWAKSKGYPWVILFDQDSMITDGFISQMFSAWEVHPERDRVGSIHPKYVDPETGVESQLRRAADGGPVYSLSSGALMPGWIFDRIGWFASEYFIDCVDFEYCLRIRAAGYLIADSRQAVLLHRVGNPARRGLLGFSFRPTNHSPARRYYMSRNRIAVCRKYFRVFPGWTVQLIRECIKETIKCFIGERDRARKFRNFLLGTWDGLTGRMGKREDL